MDTETLAAIVDTFPTHPWSGADLERLVGLGGGAITEFPRLVANIARLMDHDLGATPPLSTGRAWPCGGP